MPDDRLRQLERRWLQSGDPEDEEALNRERCRVEGHPGDTGGIVMSINMETGNAVDRYRRCKRCNAEMPHGLPMADLRTSFKQFAQEREEKIMDAVLGKLDLLDSGSMFK